MNDILGYAGKRVIVTGCFSGMGEATARILVDIGAEVHGFDYKDSALELASFRNVDLRNPGSIDAAVEAVGGTIDGLFNCAGLPQTFPMLDVMKVNYLGTRRLTERVIERMNNGGAIVSISSNGGLGWSRRVPVHMGLLDAPDWDDQLAWCEANPDEVRDGYGFSKEAVIVWTMVAATRLIKQGIRINCTTPSPTQTPMMAEFEAAAPMAVLEAAAQPIGRRSTPEEQAGPLVLLNSNAASFVNGVCLPVDAGFMGGVSTGQIDLSKMFSANHK